MLATSSLYSIIFDYCSAPISAFPPSQFYHMEGVSSFWAFPELFAFEVVSVWTTLTPPHRSRENAMRFQRKCLFSL